MKGYLLTLTGAILLSAVLSILVSDGKMGKFVKGMARLFVFSVIILPLGSFLGEKKLNLASEGIGTDDGYLKRCASLLCEQDESEIEASLKEKYSISCEAEVERGTEDSFPRKNIVLKILDDGIFGEEEHIDMVSCIQALLEDRYGCRTEVIWLEKE